MDGYRWEGAVLRVEMAREKGADRERGRYEDRGYDRGYDDRGRGGYDRGRGGYDRPPPRGDAREMGPPRKGIKSTGYRLEITSLPESASWQDLKDHVREVLGFRVPYAAIFRDRGETIGIIEFEKLSDLTEANDKLHKTTFKNRYDSSTISVRIEDDSGKAGARDRSRSRSRSRSRGRSRSRSAERGRSRSRSAERMKADSPARGGSPARD